MAYRTGINAEGQEYEVSYYSTEDLRGDVRRYRTTPEKARKRVEEIRNFIDKLLDPKTSDVRRCAIVNMLNRRLTGGYSRIEDLAALSKIANGRVDPVTHQFLEDPL
jgi:hypothetical protein